METKRTNVQLARVIWSLRQALLVPGLLKGVEREETQANLAKLMAELERRQGNAA